METINLQAVRWDQMEEDCGLYSQPRAEHNGGGGSVYESNHTGTSFVAAQLSINVGDLLNIYTMHPMLTILP